VKRTEAPGSPLPLLVGCAVRLVEAAPALDANAAHS
jgi:hypothetical protein